MFKRVTFLGLIAMLLFVVSGCTALVPVNSGLEGSGTKEAQALQGSSLAPLPKGLTEDDLLYELAKRVPAFGGMFVDESGVLNVWLTDPSLQVMEALRAAIVALWGDGWFRENAPKRVIKALKADYSFKQLYEWYKPMVDAVFQIPGVFSTAIDDLKNRLSIWVDIGNTQAAERARQVLTGLGIPLQAVIISEEERPQLLKQLNDKFRPLESGIITRIYSSISSNIYVCTMGPVVFHTGTNYLSFLANFHCTSRDGIVDRDVAAQYSLPDRVGTEVMDPAFFTGGSCPPGKRCRWSDAALIRIDSGVTATRGWIAKTTYSSSQGYGSTTIDDNAPHFRVSQVFRSDSPVAIGVTLNKMGHVTGWTVGPVRENCRHYDLAARDPLNLN